MSITDIVILIASVVLALWFGFRLGHARGARKSLNLVLSALVIKLGDEFPAFVHDLATIFKTKHDEVQSGAKLVEGFLE